MCLISMFCKLETERVKKTLKIKQFQIFLGCCYSKFHLKGNAKLSGCRTAGISKTEDQAFDAIMQKKYIVFLTADVVRGP